MNNRDSRIVEHYASNSLPDDVLTEMVEHAQSSDPKLSFLRRLQHSAKSNLFRGAFGLAALLVVAVLAHNGGVSAERTSLTLKEVAMNHTTRLDLEFESSSIDTIDEQMVLLPFDVSLPEAVSASYKVEGARYCSLSGQLAVHVKLSHPVSMRKLSVFMARAADELEAIDNSEKNIDGVDVKIWRESGLLYAMAGSFESSESIQ